MLKIVNFSLEGDELSFLYCFLIIFLDSIIYGLLALIVTKVSFLKDRFPMHKREFNV